MWLGLCRCRADIGIRHTVHTALEWDRSHESEGSPLTTGKPTELMTALKDVRAFARDEVTPEELRIVDECVRAIGRVVQRS